MVSENYKRKLTAILSADVEGYSRLMGLDEAATVRTLTAIRRSPDSLFAHINLATAYSSSGREEKARAEVVEVLRIIPKFSLEFLAKTWSIKNKADIEKYVEPLRQAGLK